ncbi:hypothetical protein NESM_000721400 [Novymonas esmeraldas]|uniref:Uncharacterized protein n=1 Tax=Novymonas esmeraldas TaxID=1808958 RepID=A0AAW0EX32_9TRYP
MVPQCFYLAALVTTAITMTLSDVSFYADGIFTKVDGTPIVVRNIAPDWIQSSSMTITSTVRELSAVIMDPIRAHATADVTYDETATLAHVTANVSIFGSFNITKTPHATDCRTKSFTMHSCDVYMTATVTVGEDGEPRQHTQNICDVVDRVANDLITPASFIPYPPALSGTSDIAKSTYLMKYRLTNTLSYSTGLPVEAHFVRKNVLRVAFGSFVRTSILFDSSYEYDVEVLDAMAVMSRWAKKKLNIATDLTNVTKTTLPFRGGSVTVPTLRSIVHQAIGENTTAVLRTRIPRGASVAVDVVINDFQCSFFNTVCSIPAENGVQAINTRFYGLGDLGTILDNTASASVDALLTNLTLAAFRLAGSTFGERIYLPVF